VDTASWDKTAWVWDVCTDLRPAEDWVRLPQFFAGKLARHSDINLTMNTYTMLGVMDQAAAVEALPAVPTNGPVAKSIAS
jgi:hypothetical protein